MSKKPKQKPSKAQVALEATRKAAYEQHVSETGMSPYNAAITAGYSNTAALQIQDRAVSEEMYSKSDFKDLAERQGVTPAKIIEYLAKRAGFFDREGGAKKIVSLTPMIRKEVDRLLGADDVELPKASPIEWDWVEVPDDSVQQKYMAQLLEFLQYTGQAKPGAVVPVGGGAKSFSIHFHVKEDDGKEIAQQVVALGLNGVNGNGAH